jgi:hypothetical protein
MISQKAAMLDFRLNLYENFKTMRHYSGGLSPGDDSHSLMCKEVSSCRALRDKSSRHADGRHELEKINPSLEVVTA